jgi:hypothetical protein
MTTTPPSIPAPGPVDTSTRHSFWERVRGALLLDPAIYEEVEHDPDALREAAGVVGLGAAAMALGAPATHGAGGVTAAVFGAGIGWFLSTGLVWLAGVKLMNHRSDYPELLRTLGFASAPHMLVAAGILPGVGGLVTSVASIWALVAYVIAVRQALDVSTGRAIVVCIVAYAAVPIVIALGLVFLAALVVTPG